MAERFFRIVKICFYKYYATENLNLLINQRIKELIESQDEVTCVISNLYAVS